MITMRPVFPFGIVVLLFVMVSGCEPDEEYHARILGGRLRGLQERWHESGQAADFMPTNYFYNHGTNQYCFFTNQVIGDGVSYKCRFGIRDPDRFPKPGILAITEDGVLLWIGDNGKIVVAPDTKRWSSKK